MSVFNVNQNRQLYVVEEVVDDKKNLDGKGKALVKTSAADFEKEVYFEVMGADTVLRSDRIPVKNITYVKAIKALDMRTPMKKVKVSLKAEVNNGNPIVGQDYILRINLRQFYGMSDQDQYFKDAAVHVTNGMDKAGFYSEMVKSLNLSFSRELGATSKENPYLSFTAASDGIVIEEKEQKNWTLGTEAQERVYFDVVPTTVYDGVSDLVWGKVAEQTPTTFVGNGKKMADLEYFLLGERGDQYRKIGWPNDIETKGVVDASKNYDAFEIHYSFTDSGVNSYKSEKDITILIPSQNNDGEDTTYTNLNNFIHAFNKATGLSIADVTKNTVEMSAPVNKPVSK